jgi:hypothetical protein
MEYPATVNKVLPLMGKATPVKNMNINMGKLPTINTSFTVFVIAAMIKLKVIMEILVNRAIKSSTISEPVYEKPRLMAKTKDNSIEINPIPIWIILMPIKNSIDFNRDNLSRSMVLFSTSVTMAMAAVNINMMRERMSNPGTE